MTDEINKYQLMELKFLGERHLLIHAKCLKETLIKK